MAQYIRTAREINLAHRKDKQSLVYVEKSRNTKNKQSKKKKAKK